MENINKNCCIHCNKFILASREFCPFCGKSQSTDNISDFQDGPITSSTNNANESPNIFVDNDGVSQDDKNENNEELIDQLDKKIETNNDLENSFLKSSNEIEDKMTINTSPNNIRSKKPLLFSIFVGIFIIFLTSIVYLAIYKKEDVEISKPSPETIKQEGISKKDVLRIKLFSLLESGTKLSNAISKIPQYEATKASAKKLVLINSRYSDQYELSSRNLDTLLSAKDEYLIKYIEKINDVGRYNYDDINQLISLLDENITSREKLVLSIIDDNLKAVAFNQDLDPRNIDDIFRSKFNNFVE